MSINIRLAKETENATSVKTKVAVSSVAIQVLQRQALLLGVPHTNLGAGEEA